MKERKVSDGKRTKEGESAGSGPKKIPLTVLSPLPIAL